MKPRLSRRVALLGKWSKKMNWQIVHWVAGSILTLAWVSRVVEAVGAMDMHFVFAEHKKINSWQVRFVAPTMMSLRS